MHSRSGDLGLITKQKPGNLASAAAELMSDADNYSIEFNPAANLTAPQKATVLASQILADYMFFDGNTEKISMDDKGVTIYCCYCSIIGWLAPCCIHIPTNN